MAQVKDNQFVYDPFVGSGSLLVAAAHFNAFVMGADLDYNLIHSKGSFFFLLTSTILFIKELISYNIPFLI